MLAVQLVGRGAHNHTMAIADRGKRHSCTAPLARFIGAANHDAMHSKVIWVVLFLYQAEARTVTQADIFFLEGTKKKSPLATCLSYIVYFWWILSHRRPNFDSPVLPLDSIKVAHAK